MNLTIKERLQLDRYILMQAKFRHAQDNEVVFGIETSCWVDPMRTEGNEIDDRIYRLYLLTKIALESTIPTHALQEWCYRYTGSVPDPINLANLPPNGEQ